eukprot:15444090-Alexandrium_andersonii.AAC.1
MNPRLAPPARAASPGALPEPWTPPAGTSGAPEAPVGWARVAADPPDEAARAGRASRVGPGGGSPPGEAAGTC